MTDPSCIKLAEEFLQFCKKNPQMRFWQALLAWSELGYIVHMPSISRPTMWEDTFFWQGRNK